jgi:hypothetical protein
MEQMAHMLQARFKIQDISISVKLPVGVQVHLLITMLQVLELHGKMLGLILEFAVEPIKLQL